MFNYKLNYFILLTFIGSLLGCHDKTGPIEQVNQQHQSPDVVDQDFSNFPKRTEYTNLGFSNLGNTCFANAVFKLLLANPEFLEFLDSTNNTTETSDNNTTETTGNNSDESVNVSKNPEENKGKKKNKKRTSRAVTENRGRKNIRRSLKKLFTRYKALERSEIDHPQLENKTNFFAKELNSVFTNFNNYLGKSNGKEEKRPSFKEKEIGFIPGEQQDAHEFLKEILTEVLEFNKHQPFYQSTRPESADGVRKNGATSHIFFPINVQISNSKVNSLSDAFDKIVEEETLSPENGVRPDQGGENLTQLKTKIAVLNFDQIPSYFFATVNRFNNNLEKDGKYIDSKTPIRMRIFQTSDSKDKKKPEWEDNAKSITIDYEPIGFVVHSGNSPYGGHYYSYIYDDHSKSWFEHNDSSVTKINHPTDVEKTWNDINENGYIVLYREKQRAPAY